MIPRDETIIEILKIMAAGRGVETHKTNINLIKVRRGQMARTRYLISWERNCLLQYERFQKLNK